MTLILVGRVAGAFGVRGELRLSTYTADPMALKAYGTLVGADGSPVLTLTSARPLKPGEIAARARGIETRDQAEALKGLKLHVPRQALAEPEEDEFYLVDLIGLEVRGLDGRPLGRVKAVPNFGAGDLIEVDPGDGSPTWYLPFTRKAVPEVRIAEGLILADPPPLTDEGPEPTV